MAIKAAEFLKALDRDFEVWEQNARVIVSYANDAARRLTLPGSLVPTGSYATGFANVSSDIDLVFVPTQIGRRADPVTVLRRIHQYLNTISRARSLTQIFRAKGHPTLKLTDDSGIEVDIVYDNPVGMRNTDLLKAYSIVDPVQINGMSRTRVFVRLVKEVCRKLGLIGTVEGSLNAFSVTLLVIYFLQKNPPGGIAILPNLQEDKLSENAPSIIVNGWETKFANPYYFPGGVLRPQSRDPETLGAVNDCTDLDELLYHFFHFYGYFDFANYCVSISEADEDIGELNPKRALDSVWEIRDPFQLDTNLATHTTHDSRRRIVQTFRVLAHDYFQNESFPSVLFDLDYDTPYKRPFLKTRFHHSVRLQEIIQLFEHYNVLRMFITPVANFCEAYLQFPTYEDCRAAMELNETILSDGSYISLYISLGFGLWRRLGAFIVYTPDFCQQSADYLRPLLEPIFADPLDQSSSAVNDPNLKNPLGVDKMSTNVVFQ